MPKQKMKMPLCRSTRFTIDGVSKTLINWTNFYNINYGAVYNRIADMGWDIRVALTRPVGKPGDNMRDSKRMWDGNKYITVDSNQKNNEPKQEATPKPEKESREKAPAKTVTAEVRESLPEELREIFDQLLDAYKFHAMIIYNSRMFPPRIVGELVRDGWRLSAEARDGK